MTNSLTRYGRTELYLHMSNDPRRGTPTDKEMTTIGKRLKHALKLCISAGYWLAVLVIWSSLPSYAANTLLYVGHKPATLMAETDGLNVSNHANATSSSAAPARETQSSQ